MTSPDVPSRAGSVLTVDLAAVAENYRRLSRRAAPAACAAVVKADAYGLGAARVVPALVRAGCRSFFTALLDEALAVRAAAPEAEIAVLAGPLPGTEAEFAAHRLVPVLNHLGDLERWRGFLRGRGEALPAMLHVDTGMNRLGLGADEFERLAGDPELLRGVPLRAVVSHLARAEERDEPMNAAQLARFRRALGRLPPAPASLANSSGIFLGPDYLFDLVRPGCALYGVNPTPGAPNPMLPVVRVEARILQVRRVDSPETVGYGAVHRIDRPGRIATIALGYADGYPRSLGGRGHVYLSGRAAPVVGRISMDLMTVDVTDLPESQVVPGALVEVIGRERTVDAVADEAGTIGYEILTALGRRHHRVYVGHGAEEREE